MRGNEIKFCVEYKRASNGQAKEKTHYTIIACATGDDY